MEISLHISQNSLEFIRKLLKKKHILDFAKIDLTLQTRYQVIIQKNSKIKYFGSSIIINYKIILILYI